VNPLAKRIIPKVIGKVAGPLFKRIMDRRAAKGGKLVLWWRRTFGEIGAEQVGETSQQYAERFLDEIQGKRK
jgi:hypothetical protein